MNSPFRATLARLWRLRVLMALSLIWVAPTLACGSFAPRPTPTPTTPPAVNPVATQVATNAPGAQTLVTPPPAPPPATPVATPAPEVAATPTLTPTVGAGGSVLAKGNEARITAPAGLNYREQPAAAARLLGQFGTGIRVMILDGPITADGFTWWQVDDGQGNVGWAAEGDDDTTWISPQLGEPQPANRAPRVGDRVVVTMAQGGQLSVRTQPGTDAALVARVDPGQEYTVQAGPQEADGFTWYQIRADDGSVEGWAADGDGEDRWLSPLE